MGDIQFYRGYVNQQAAEAGRFGQRAAAPATQGPDAKTPHETAAAQSESEGEFGFDDFLDIINPLQHIPIVSTLYRELTGDEISAPARIFGGTLFGGPSGFVSAVANTLFDEVAGGDVGASVLAFFGGDGADDDTQLAKPNTGLPGTDLAGEAFSTPPLVTAASRATADPTGPEPVGAATNTVIPAGLLPITTPPMALSPGALPPADRAPRPVPAPPADSRQANPLQESDREQGNGTDGVLTGQDALSALFNDLRGSAAAAPLTSVPAPAQTEPARETRPRRQISGNDETTGRVVNAPAGAQMGGQLGLGTDTTTAPDPAVPDAALANQMLMALDKYQAMTRQRGLANPPPPKPDQPDHP